MKLYPTLRRRAAILTSLAVLFAATTLSRAAVPEVLTEVPDNAPVVIVLKNLKDVNTKLANTATRVNLGGPQDPLNAALTSMGFTKGIDMAGDAALVLIPQAPAADDQNEKPDGPPPMVLLLPTNDAKALLEPFKPTDAIKGISEIMLPQNPDEKGYAATLARHVAIAQDKDVLAAFLAKKGALSKAATPESLKAFENNDLTIYANINALGKQAVESIESQREQTAMMLDLMLLSGASPKEAAAAKEIVSMVFDGLKQFMTDANTGLITVRLSDAGITLGASGHFKAESDIGKLVAAQKAKAPLTLAHLPTAPNGDLLAAGAVAWEGKSVADRLLAASDRFFKNPAFAEDKEAKKTFDDSVKTLPLIDGVSFVLMPPADKSAGKMAGASLVYSSDAKKLLTSYRDLYKQKGMQELASMNPDIKTEITYKENERTVKGVQLDRVQMKYTLREETAESPLSAESKQAFEAIQKLYGEQGQVMYYGIVNNTLVSIIGDDAKVIDLAVDAVQNKKEELARSKEVTAVAKEVLPDPIAVSYLPVDNWLKLAEVGGPDDGKAVLPTVVSMNVVGANLNVEMFMPMGTAAKLVEVGKMFAPLLGGGGGFGPPMQP